MRPLRASKCTRTWLPRLRMAEGAMPSRRVSASRSEEHTSELQSRLHLVCRLLLEKKKHDLVALRLDLPRLHVRPALLPRAPPVAGAVRVGVAVAGHLSRGVAGVCGRCFRSVVRHA